MHDFKHKHARIFAVGICLILILLHVGIVPAWANETDFNESTAVWRSPLNLFQSFFSKADGQRCSSYPSCSHYAAQAFERHGLLKGWILTCDRLLRCGRDETRRSPSVIINGVRRTHDPIEANTFWWSHP